MSPKTGTMRTLRLRAARLSRCTRSPEFASHRTANFRYPQTLYEMPCQKILEEENNGRMVF